MATAKKGTQARKATQAASSAQTRGTSKTAKTAKTSKSSIKHAVFGLPSESLWLGSLKNAGAADSKKRNTANVFYFVDQDKKFCGTVLKRAGVLGWQLEQVLATAQEVMLVHARTGPAWVIRTSNRGQITVSESHGGRFTRGAFVRGRELMGQVGVQILGLAAQKGGPERVILNWYGSDRAEEEGAYVGLELSAYSYQAIVNTKKAKKRPKLLLNRKGSWLEIAQTSRASALAESVNLARHLVNVPGQELNPKTMAQTCEALFKSAVGFELEIWDDQRLEKERCHLIRAVGAGGAERPCLIHLKYRPKAGDVANTRPPIAIVGKGITFDSGGLDIKPSSGMRWMKKDMGGSAAVIGFANWVARTQPQIPCDFYLAVAENAVDANSFHPGDVVTARSGLTVEIHNTDAEGRLVLADALDVAINQKEKPALVINLATLTGAIKVGLGADVAGLFCNHDDLAGKIESAATEAGEWVWRMPLFMPYKSLLRSTFADMANSSDGFAGAITAALFLEAFVGGLPWAHLDIYAWRDGAQGPYAESGGNGQGVQMLVNLIENLNRET